MRVMLSIGLHYSRFSCSCSDVAGECFGDRSHTLVTLIINRLAACPMILSYLPLVALSAVSLGDLALASSSSPRMVAVPWEMPVQEEPTSESREALSADETPPGAVSFEVDGAGPRPSDDAGGSLQGLLMRVG
jgi:hypothetical protein